jgi:hypothetical protein
MMKRGIAATTLAMTAVAGVAAAVACSSSSNSGGGGGGNPQNMMACAAVASAICHEMQMCDPLILDANYGDEPTCETRNALNCNNSLVAPGTGASASSDQACASAYSSLSCTDYLNRNTPMACNVQPGSGGKDSPCAFSAQCQSGFCAIQPGVLCGTCAPAPPMAGASCLMLTNCGTGLVCAAGVCVAYAQNGAACNPRTAPCGAGLSCVGSTPTTMGKCMTAATTAGAACDATLKTSAGCSTELGLTCNTVTKKCDMIVAAQPGQACGGAVGSGTKGYEQVDCGKGGAATCVKGKCQFVAQDGQPCDTLNGPDCMPPARCIGSPNGDAGTIAGTCKVPDASMCH